MRQIFFALFILLPGAAVSAAEDQSSGNYWLSLCQKKQNDYACAYYINGLIDGLTMAVTETSLVSRGDAHKVYGYCAPATVSVGDMKEVFKKYLNDHPENRKYTGASLALDAWRKAWPCKK
jgi:hypothetical protein